MFILFLISPVASYPSNEEMPPVEPKPFEIYLLTVTDIGGMKFAVLNIEGQRTVQRENSGTDSFRIGRITSEIVEVFVLGKRRVLDRKKELWNRKE